MGLQLCGIFAVRDVGTFCTRSLIACYIPRGLPEAEVWSHCICLDWRASQGEEGRKDEGHQMGKPAPVGFSPAACRCSLLPALWHVLSLCPQFQLQLMRAALRNSKSLIMGA